MSLAPGTYEFGPDNGTLAVRTTRTGAAAKAGHDLLIHVTAWQATLVVGADSAPTSLVLDADATSLRVLEGSGGIQELGDDDKANIEQTIDDEILKRQRIEFRSTAVRQAVDGGTLSVEGELTLVGRTGPIAFDLAPGADGAISGAAVVKQTEWGITPYSTLFGALKVVDEVEVVIVATQAGRGRATRGPAWSELAGVGSRVHPRAPSIDPGVSSFLWTLFFFPYILFGLVAVGVSHGTARAVALVAASLIFVLIRTLGAAGRDDRRG